MPRRLAESGERPTDSSPRVGTRTCSCSRETSPRPSAGSRRSWTHTGSPSARKGGWGPCEASDARVYTFLDVSEAVGSACGLELGCLASCIAIFRAALAAAWAATGRALRPAAEAEARERAFICTASHDLVTPLMAVTANWDVLETEASNQAGLASWVANIRAAADEMATRIADMLMHVGGD